MKLTRDEFEAIINKYEPNVILPDGGDMVLTKDQCLNWFASRCNLSAPSFYARMLTESDPELAGLFALRKQKIQSSIGPSNDGLPEGTHKV